MRHPPPLVRLATYAVAAAALVLGAALFSGQLTRAATPFDPLSTKRLTVYEGVLQIHSQDSPEIMELGQRVVSNPEGQAIISSGKLYIQPGTGNGAGASAANSYFSTPSNGTSTQDFFLSGRFRVNGSGSTWPDVVSIYATQDINSALYVEQSGAGYAGYFSGKVEVTGDLIAENAKLNTCKLSVCGQAPLCDDAASVTEGYPFAKGVTVPGTAGCAANEMKITCCKITPVVSFDGGGGKED